jgi:hypothetical protein
MRSACSMLAAFLVLTSQDRIEVAGRLDHPDIREASGIVRSRRHPDIFWVHNDSGNPPVLFAVRRDGALVRAYQVGVPNVDWEDLTIDDGGHLYLGDIGNNDGRLPLRAVYRLAEPDPGRGDDSPLQADQASFYRFPSRDARFDAESLILLDGRAVMITKRLDGGEAQLMAVPLDPPAPLTRPALPVNLGRLPGCTDPITGADLSGDGRELAVCSTSQAWVYRREKDLWRRIGQAAHDLADAEGICWDGRDLLVVGEGRGLRRVPESVWSRGVSP